MELKHLLTSVRGCFCYTKIQGGHENGWRNDHQHSDKGLFLVCAAYALKYRLYRNKYMVALLSYIVWLILVTYLNGMQIGDIGSYLNVFSCCVVYVYCLERNPQRIIGYLLYALTYYGIGTCPLIWNDDGEKAEEIRRFVDIPWSEQIVAIIQVGHYATNECKYAASNRRAVFDVLKIH